MKKGLIVGLLGILVSSSFLPVPAVSAAGELPTNRPWTKCADEEGFCSFEGTKELRFGANGNYKIATATDGMDCNTEVFNGDPAPNVRKQCDMRDLLEEGAPEATGYLSEDYRTLMIGFDQEAKLAGTEENLRNALTIRRTGASSFAALEAADTVAYDVYNPDKLVLSLAQPLVGSSNAVAIAPHTLLFGENEDAFDKSIVIDSIVGADITPPAFIGAESRATGAEVKLRFDESFEIAYPADAMDEAGKEAYLLSGLQIAQDGEHFSPLVNGIAYARPYGSELIMGYSGGLKMVSGPKTKIRIAAGWLKDESGNANPELTLSVSPPAIHSSELSLDNHDLTIEFDHLIYVTQGLDSDALKSGIRVMDENGRYFNPGADDTVSISGNKLLLHLEKALSGKTIQVVLGGGFIQSAEGSYSIDMVISRHIPVHAVDGAADTTPPKFVNYLLSSDLKDLTLIFNEDVALDDTDLAAFKNDIHWRSTQWSDSVLPADSTVTVSGRTVKIHFATYSSPVYYFYGQLNRVKDLAGNASDSSFNTSYFNVGNSTGIRLSDGYIGLKGRFLGLAWENPYSNELADVTLDENGVSQLKNLISISSDNGATFRTLSDGDKIVLKDNLVGIFLNNPIQSATVQVKITAGAIMDSHRYKANEATHQTISYTDSKLSGYLFSDADTVLKFEDDSAWSNSIRSVKVWTTYYSYRELTDAEYSVGNGKLTLAKGIFLQDQSYTVQVDAEGYSSRMFEGDALKSSDVFYMTAPEVAKTNGVTAKVFIYNQAQSDSAGVQSVVFELFDGMTPISIASSELNVGTGTYTAKFNVSNAASKAYTVKVFLVSSFDSDTMDLGLNLGTVKTQMEIDEAMLKNMYND